jgi:hypothetical protein
VVERLVVKRVMLKRVVVVDRNGARSGRAANVEAGSY